jgi:hypothetical protein
MTETLIGSYDPSGAWTRRNKTQCRSPSRHSPAAARCRRFQIIELLRRTNQQMFDGARTVDDVVPQELAIM